MSAPYDEVISLPDREAVGIWKDMCGDCRGTQERLLTCIVESARDTAYGRDHNFDRIGSVEDFRREVPISDYEDLEPYIDRLARGEADVLFAGATDYFISTSGTTGKAKMIPECRASLNAKNAVNKLRNACMAVALQKTIAGSRRLQTALASMGVDLGAMSPRDLAGKFAYYSVTSAIPDRRTEGGISIGFASGKTFEGSGFSDMLSYPSEFMGLSDGEATMYLTMMFALRHDNVALVTSNNAARLHARLVYAQEHAEEIISDIRNGTVSPRLSLSEEERRIAEGHAEPDPASADRLQKILDTGRENFTPRNYWPCLAAARFWLGGSVGVNVDKVRPFLPDDVMYFDIGYGASEAKINIPTVPGSPVGVLGTMSVFYEFVPLDGGEPLLADELEDGGEYELLLTNIAGLYRYRMHDIVRVVGFTGNTPNVEFVTKSREILNIAQEKLPAPSVLDCVNEVTSSLGFVPRQTQIYENIPAQAYDVYIELESGHPPVDVSVMSEALDGKLRERFELYNRNRMLGSLNRLTVHLMRDGWQESLFRKRESEGAPRSQIKLDTRIRSRPEDDWIIREDRR